MDLCIYTLQFLKLQDNLHLIFRAKHVSVLHVPGPGCQIPGVCIINNQ